MLEVVVVVVTEGESRREIAEASGGVEVEVAHFRLRVFQVMEGRDLWEWKNERFVETIKERRERERVFSSMKI